MSHIKSRLRRALPQPALKLLRQLRGYWRSRRYADPRLSSQMLGAVDPGWAWRIETAVSCPDNAFIPRVPDAGRLRDGLITMHNGLKVVALGYYGSGNMNLLVENRGVHEPQEERAFAEVLRHIPPGGSMLELGAYWGFYSLWFATTVERPRNFLVEPEPENLASARQNFRHNGATATFDLAYVGAEEGRADVGTPIVSVDGYCARHAIDHLSILHADIQGAEADMLRGARRMLGEHRVDYVFLSTHSDQLHADCRATLEAYGYAILASADMEDSYSIDGLIVAKLPALDQPTAITIAHRRTAGAAAAAPDQPHPA